LSPDFPPRVAQTIFEGLRRCAQMLEAAAAGQ